MKRYNFVVKKGDSFNGQEFQGSVNDVFMDLNGASIKADFYRNETYSFTMSTDNDRLSITDASNGVFIIKPQIFNEDAGIYKYDLQITFEDGTIKTYIYGTLKINADITS